MKIIALDFGKARTGVAVCDKSEILASPYCVIPSYNYEKLLEKLKVVIPESGAEMILVGKPLRTDGKNSEMAENAEKFAKDVAELSGLPVEMLDERFTTVIASRQLHANSKSSKQQKNLIDAAAAAVLLQGYIDSRKK